MSTIEGIVPITAAEFPRRKGTGRPLCAERAAMEKLEVGQGFKCPCRWKHDSQGRCQGTSLTGKVAERDGFSLKSTCRDGVFYVLRTG